MIRLDSLFRSAAPWWDKFYEDNSKGIPFFIDYPDENLVSYFSQKRIIPGKILELGCGNGHFGTVYFASGYEETSGVQEKSDMSVYKIYAMQGGMAYSIESLRDILSDFFEEIEIRAMLECNNNEELFGKSFLWVSLWRKKCNELHCT